MNKYWKLFRLTAATLMLGTCILLSSCATTAPKKGELPPILTQEELVRPYTKLGVIEVHRERYGSTEDLSPADFSWGHQALREEAAKMGADAVIYPELKTERETYIVFPTSQMTAKGTAIKFR